MSIISLMKVSICGHTDDKTDVLADLQDIGCLHVIPLHSKADKESPEGPTPLRIEALKFIENCPYRRRQIRNPETFDAAKIARTATDIQNTMRELQDEADFLRGQIKELEVWGDFSVPSRKDLGNLRLWFYKVPHYKIGKISELDVVWEVVRQDSRYIYVIVISESPPQGMPVSQTDLGTRSLSELANRLEEVEVKLEDLQSERISLTRWCELFRRNLDRLEDESALQTVVGQTYDQKPVFVLQGWAPRDARQTLEAYAGGKDLALIVEEPQPGEVPPTLLKNSPRHAGGQDLVSFYMTPSYWSWDPSAVVFFSFTIFFAMILSDAGYAVLLAIALMLGWRRLGEFPMGQRLRLLFTTLIGGSVVWGVLAGSYFGTNPVEGSLLNRFRLFDLSDSATMMRFSILVGVIHVVIANLADAWNHGLRSKALAPAGWIAIIVGGYVLWLGTLGVGPASALRTFGSAAMIFGSIAVLLFSCVEVSFGKRLFNGLLALYKITNAFGDILSYLRLFALGLASSSLALAFNDLASQMVERAPGFGTLLAVLILFIGHGLNLSLAIMSGFVHGLRLNFIEFFKWGLSDEGRPFRAFSKKEKLIWN